MRMPLRCARPALRPGLCAWAALCLCLPAWGAPAREFVFDPEPAEGRRVRRVRYGFTASNTSGEPLRAARLRVAVPLRHAAGQQAVRLRCSHAADCLIDTNGNPALCFVLDGLPPYGQREIAIEAEVLTAGPPDDPEPAGPAAAAARRAFGQVTGALVYDGYHKAERGAAWALAHGRGDCSEYAAALVARCREAGVRARRVSGFCCKRDGILDPAGFHSWVEYHDGRAWRAADPFYGRFAPSPADYVGFVRHADPDGGAAVFRCSGEGLRVRMHAPGGGGGAGPPRVLNAGEPRAAGGCPCGSAGRSGAAGSVQR